MKKRIISLLLVFAMVFSLIPSAALAASDTQGASVEQANPFTDVKETDWFYDAVRYARVNGFFNGTSETTFWPEGTMTRGMFVTVLGRMAGVDAGRYQGESSFSDVPADAYYAPYVAWASQYGVTVGTGDGKFSPNENIDRQQMATFFVRYFELFDVDYETGAGITTTPGDIDKVSSWAKESVLKLWRTGLLNGDGTDFDPTGNATRAQAATLCMRTDKSVKTWYQEPGVPSERVSIDPTTGAPSGKPEKPETPSTGGESSGGGGFSSGGTSQTTYYEVQFALGNSQPDISLPKPQTTAKDTPISSLPTPAKAGVIFLGWYYDAELTRRVETGDTVTKNMTLYAKTAAGEEVQPIETPNYVTLTELQAGAYSFDVAGVAGDSDIKAAVKFINITGGNMPVDYTVSGSTVSAVLEAGQTYKVELLDEKAKFVLGGDEQDASVRVLNILTKKEEVKKAELNKDVKQIPLSATTGLTNTVFKGLYQIDDTQTVSKNTTSGMFTYTGKEPLTVGQTLAVTQGEVNLTDVTSDSGDVAYIKITGVNSDNNYSYEMADVEDVLHLPDVLPIQNGWDADSSENTVTISADNLSTALNNVNAASLDEGDFLAFINGAYNSESGTASSYGRVTEYCLNGDNYVITYATATENDIESALDVYYQEDKDIKVTTEDKERIESDLQKDIQKSGYAKKAASYVMAVMEESGGLDTAPDPAAVAAYMGTISTYARADGSIALYAGGKKAEAKVDWTRFRVSIDGYAEHLHGNGFDINVAVPITLEMDSVTIDFTAVFEEEVILGQSISTKRHKIGFLKYDYSLNASFDIGNYTGVHFQANVRTQDGGDDKSLSKKLDDILEKMEEYGKLLESGGVSGTDGTMESLSDIYKEVMDSASDSWVDVINQQLFDNSGSAFLHIFCWQIKGSFVVSVNMAVAMGMDFEYTTRKCYNFSVRVKAKTSTNETIDLITPNYSFDFYVIGTIGVRAGLRLEMYVGLISLQIDRIGIVAEVGVYTQLWGYFFYHLEWKQGVGKKSNSAGALLIEIGMYLDIKFVATLFNSSKLTWAPTIYANQWPLWSAGERQNVYAFADSGGTYDFKTSKTLALPGSTYTMQSMDMKTGVISQVNKDDNSESSFIISFSNPAFQYTATNNTVTVAPPAGSLNEETDMTITWKKVPLAFTSKPIQKVIHIKWSDPEGMRYISFVSMGGSAVPQITGGEGAAITWPADPVKPGYTFAGWYKNPSFENSRVEKMDTMPKFFPGTKGMLLFAKWVPAEVDYTVEHYQQALNGTYELKETETKRGLTESQTAAAAKTYTGFTAKAFDQQTIAADGSSVVKIYYDRNNYTVTWKPGYDGAKDIVQTYKYGAELTPPTVGREGYIFTGWDVTPPETVTGNAVYTARWEGVQNPVTFNAMGGSETAATTVPTGERITRPADPTRNGYAFGGWYSDQNCTKKWDFSTEVTGAVTLFAKWIAKAYTVTLDPVEGTLAGDSTRSVTFGQPYGVLPEPSLQGYDFAGWYTANGENGKKVEADTVVETAGEHTLYARWTPGDVTYTVKHLWQNAEDNGYTQHEKESLTGTVMTETAAKAKTYEGFGPAKEFAQAVITPDGTTVIEIKYDRLTYTVTWINDGTTYETTSGVKFGAVITKPADPTKENYDFAGWAGYTDAMTMGNTDATFTAKWTPKTYRVTLNADNGSTASALTEYTYGEGAALPDASRTGYTFGGWYTDSSFTGSPMTAISTTDYGNKVFYAKWTANTYTVTLDPNGGTLTDEQKERTVTYDQTYGGLPTPTKVGSDFDGWYTERDGGTKVAAGTNVTITNSQTLYAHWTARSYTITFNTAGGSGVNPITGTFGTPVTKPADPTRAGYTFAGWDKEIPDTMPAESMTITAKWTANTYKVTLNPNGGTVTDNSITVTYGETYSLPTPTPPDSNHNFMGWYQGDEKFADTGIYQIDGNITLTARWEIVQSKTTTYTGFAGPIELYIGGRQMDPENRDIPGIESIEYNAGGGVYILTLNGYIYEEETCALSGRENAVIYFDGKGTDKLVIEVKGDNTLTCNALANGSAFGIFAEEADLYIQGSGTLNVTANSRNGTETYGIFARKTLRISGDGIINAEANVDERGESNNIYYWCAIVANSLDMKGGTVTATANQHPGKDKSYALNVPAMSITGGSFTAKGYTTVCSRTVDRVSLGNGVTAVVSNDYDGSNPTAYESDTTVGAVKYFHASSTP